jgi:Macrocin-O-methyltransferase (TylF)
MTGQDPKHGGAAARSPFGANVPQRYSAHAERYAARGGRIRLAEDARGFLTGADGAPDMARFYFLCLIFDQIVKEGLTGDLAELGVYKGNTASLLAIMARRLGSTAYLLDTFEGFSERDLKGVDAGIKRGFSDTSVEGVRALVGDQNVQFVQGHFPASSSQLPPDVSFCLVHLDCDLYAPMASALTYFYPRLVPGGFLIMHDYSSLHWDGAERAVDEFLANKAEALVPMPDSCGSAVIRKARKPDRYRNWYTRRNAGLFGHEWTEAAGGKLSAILGEGWSTAENWGVWGIDEAHGLFVYLSSPPESDVVLEFDVSAFLLENATRREVHVRANGQTLDRWIFTSSANQSVRELRIPPVHLPAGD